MPNGVPSSFQVNKPWPVYLERGEGARVWDVDGGEYVDFHNGFGVMAVGHANPTDRRGGQGPDRPRHPLRRPHRRLDRRRRGARRPLRPAAVAVHELRHRVDDGRGPPRPRGHRPRHDPEDRGLLPRPPRLGHGQRLSRRSRRSATATTRARSPTAPAIRWRSPSSPAPVPFNDADGARERARQARRPGRRADHGAGDDEHQHHPAASRATSSACASSARPRREADLRRGQDRRHDRPRRRHRALRRHAGHHHPGEGDLRRLPRRRDRDDRRARRGDRRRHRGPVRDLQRQPAGDGGRRGDPDQGPDPGRLREARGRPTTGCSARCDEIIEQYGLPCYTQGIGAKGCVVFSPERAVRVPRLPDQGRRRALDAWRGSTT